MEYMMRRRTRTLNWNWVGSVTSQTVSIRRYLYNLIGPKRVTFILSNFFDRICSNCNNLACSSTCVCLIVFLLKPIKDPVFFSCLVCHASAVNSNKSYVVKSYGCVNLLLKSSVFSLWCLDFSWLMTHFIYELYKRNHLDAEEFKP